MNCNKETKSSPVAFPYFPSRTQVCQLDTAIHLQETIDPPLTDASQPHISPPPVTK